MHYIAFLNLSPADLDALRRQGFVSQEARAGSSYYKLRFRRHGRQVVIGLGNDPELAEKIGRELAQLQADRRADRDDRRLIRAARRLLRRTKRELEPALRDAGFRYYGREIRKLRTKRHSRKQEG